MKYTTSQIIEELKREQGQRYGVYPKLIKQKKLDKATADLQQDILNSLIGYFSVIEAIEVNGSLFPSPPNDDRGGLFKFSKWLKENSYTYLGVEAREDETLKGKGKTDIYSYKCRGCLVEIYNSPYGFMMDITVGERPTMKNLPVPTHEYQACMIFGGETLF